MKIAIGSDHAGFRYKEKIKQLLEDLGHVVNDFGTDSEEPVDYPLFIRPVALAVARATLNAVSHSAAPVMVKRWLRIASKEYVALSAGTSSQRGWRGSTMTPTSSRSASEW